MIDRERQGKKEGGIVEREIKKQQGKKRRKEDEGGKEGESKQTKKKEDNMEPACTEVFLLLYLYLSFHSLTSFKLLSNQLCSINYYMYNINNNILAHDFYKIINLNKVIEKSSSVK